MHPSGRDWAFAILYLVLFIAVGRRSGLTRELRNLLERAAILSEGGLIVNHFVFRPAPGGSTPARMERRSKEIGDLKNVERDMIEQALVAAKFNRSQAAKALGITRAQLDVNLRQ